MVPAINSNERFPVNNAPVCVPVSVSVRPVEVIPERLEKVVDPILTAETFCSVAPEKTIVAGDDCTIALEAAPLMVKDVTIGVELASAVFTVVVTSGELN